MSKNDRKKAGLHKEVSSIFKGVVIPGREDGTESSVSSKPEDTGNVVPTVLAVESQEGEVQKPYQAVQTLIEVEPPKESKAEPVEEVKAESIEETKVEPIEEAKAEMVEETKAEPVEEHKVEPVEEPKVESVEKSKVKPVSPPKFMTAQESNVVPIEESEIESVEDYKVKSAQETKGKPVSTPKFVTTGESKVVPIQESEDGPTPEAEDKSISSPTLVTAGKSKVIPVQESEVGPAQESETEQDKQTENKPVNKGIFKKDKKLKVIPVKESKKAGIDKISKKVSEKRPVVKVGGGSSWKQITSKLFGGDSGAGGAKQKAMVVMVPLLFIVLVIFVLKGGVFGTSANKTEAGDENNASSIASADLNNEIDWEVPQAYPTKLRDPMKLGPVVTDKSDSGGLVELVVKSILYSEDNPSAIIGNRIAHEGDRIQDANIIKINKDSVEFEMNGKKWTQKVHR